MLAFLEKHLVPFANKFGQNKYLKAISDGFASLLPIIMIGAIFTLLANLQITPYQRFLEVTRLGEIFSFAPTVTTDMLAVYAVFLMGKSFANRLLGEEDDKGANVAGILSLFAFFLMIPLGVTGTEGDVTVSVANALETRWLGAGGLFSAIIIALLVAKIYVFIVVKEWVIKMPDGVPPTIGKSFAALIPGFAIAFIFSVIRFGFSLTQWGGFNDFIYSFLQAPLENLGASPFTFILFTLLSAIFWFFGIHGGMIVMPFLNVLYTSANLENLEAYANGLELPNTIVQANWFTFANLGGAGGTLGLCIIMAFFAKSKRYKKLGQLALPASLCGINEPITFGLPVILNTIILIPFVLTPVINFAISYALISFGVITPLIGAPVPVGTPVIFSGWLASGGSISVVLVQVLLIVVQVFIYFPFFKMLDKQASAEEEISIGAEV